MLHKRIGRFQRLSKYFKHTSINKRYGKPKYVICHFLNEICNINILVKQNEIFLNNMQSNPLFESLLHIILKVLRFVLPITLYYFSNTLLINHENMLLEITC